jgi:hypothetical protein
MMMRPSAKLTGMTMLTSHPNGGSLTALLSASGAHLVSDELDGEPLGRAGAALGPHHEPGSADITCERRHSPQHCVQHIITIFTITLLRLLIMITITSSHHHHPIIITIHQQPLFPETSTDLAA